MWGRLAKKLADTATAHAVSGDGDDANEGSADPPVTASKKRKAAGTSQAGNSSAKGKIALQHRDGFRC